MAGSHEGQDDLKDFMKFDRKQIDRFKVVLHFDIDIFTLISHRIEWLHPISKWGMQLTFNCHFHLRYGGGIQLSLKRLQDSAHLS